MMMRGWKDCRWAGVWMAIGVIAFGCGRSDDVNVEVRDAGAQEDAGGLLGGPTDAGPEDAAASDTDGGGGATSGGGQGGTDGEIDSAGDAVSMPQEVCSPGQQRCLEGDRLDVCNADGSAWQARPCQEEGAFCGADGDSVGCVPWVCEPGVALCLGERDRGNCNARGSDVVVDLQGQCPERCEAGACVGEPQMEEGDCGLQEVTPLPLDDTIVFNLCEEGDDFANTQAPPGCGADGERFPGRDRVFVLTLTEPTTVALDLSDADDGAAIDTVVYVRSACRDADSQQACGDDVLCSDSDIDVGCQGQGADSVQVRQSRLTLDLDAGNWYVVADQYTYNQNGQGFTCGTVRLQVRAL
ncbi:MAG: hypothetical protein AAFS10_05060 [Myxococcota bacterium]